MTCSTCGRENPAHLTFCQECGQRLGPRIAPPTPPIGLGPQDAYGPPPVVAAQGQPQQQHRGATALGMTSAASDVSPYAPPPAERRCKICDTVNGPNLRYCTSCGSTLEPAAGGGVSRAPAPPPQQQAAPVAAAPAPAPAAIVHGPSAIAPMRVVDLGTGGAPVEARTCSRCRGVADTTAQFCKFCGASLADAQPVASPQVSAAPASPMLPHERLDLPRGGNGSPDPSPVAMTRGPTAPFNPQQHQPQARPTAPAPIAQAAPAPQPIAQAPILSPAPSPVFPNAAAYGPPPGAGAAAALAAIPRAASAPPPQPQQPPQASHLPQPHQPAPAAPVASRAPSPATTRGRLVVIAKSGADGPSYPFGDLLDIGRSEGNVVVAEDPYLSPRHVRIVWQNNKLTLRDLGSTNGVFLRLAPSRDTTPRRSTDNPEVAVPLIDNDLILVGQQVLRFDILRENEGGFGPAQEHGTLLFGSPAAPRYARLCQRTVEGIARDIYYVRKVETVLGRESGDVVFTEDPFLSRRHAAIRLLSRDGGAPAGSKPPPGEARFALVDLGSSNGTFLRIRGDVELAPGDHFRVGQQLFRVDFDIPPGGRG